MQNEYGESLYVPPGVDPTVIERWCDAADCFEYIEDEPYRTALGGVDYVFCSPHCRKRFEAEYYEESGWLA